MSTQIKKDNFETIYNKTYSKTLRFIVVKCNNLDDINDIIQDTYIELLKAIRKHKPIEEEIIDKYIMGIANNVIKRHYYKKKKENVVSFYIDDEHEIDAPDNFDMEQDFITKENVRDVWNYVKNKDLLTAKIFYLYFVLDLKISEIAGELEITESNTKNKIYRTLKEIKKYLGKDVINND